MSGGVPESMKRGLLENWPDTFKPLGKTSEAFAPIAWLSGRLSMMLIEVSCPHPLFTFSEFMYAFPMDLGVLATAATLVTSASAQCTVSACTTSPPNGTLVDPAPASAPIITASESTNMEPYFNSMLLHAITTLNIISFATFDIIISHSPLCVLVGSPRVAYAHLHVVFISDKPLLVLDEILSATNAIEHGWWPGASAFCSACPM
ncbi:uncharacterized protein PITG_15444 [Phytophthora infestans T30-4]|uniref:Uncharacterized protein n=1 Tax=Phytophthora infestans (strain T30-4) TaxID=403677 RepID=D0NR96_PHYIT|nr:uncharacterized protein PITG_15444 [Phytophthora infestans T30-4]EEY63218.1 conserved hypothetical protein [Phytophthora infestans T30-4]|eukprot:XP_002898395.1 conserved hypothetical protein [Phytophthora infestans T30-4]